MPLNLTYVEKNKQIKVNLWEEPTRPRLPFLTLSQLPWCTPLLSSPQPPLYFTPPLFTLRTNHSGSSSEAPGCTAGCTLDQQITVIPIWVVQLHVFRQLKVFLVEGSSGYVDSGCNGFKHPQKNVPFLLCLRAALTFHCRPGYKLHGYKTYSSVSGLVFMSIQREHFHLSSRI